MLHARPSMSRTTSGHELFQHRAVSCFWLIFPIKRQRLPASTMRMGADPGVFLGKSPGLDRRAAGAVQACPYDAAIDIGLPGQVVSPRLSARIDRKRDVKFGNVNLQTERREPGDVGS